MPVKLNLLPQNLMVSKSLGAVLKTIRALNVILIVGFIIFVLGLGGYFIISNNSLNISETKVTRLKVQVLAQESSEQQLILLKDRLAKIASVGISEKTLGNINNINSFLNNVSAETIISQLDVDSDKVNLSLTIKSNSDLTKFMESLDNTILFNTVTLSSFSYSSLNGYVLDLIFNTK